LKKGLADTFENFDEYQLNKYKNGLKDVLRITHPKPKNEYQNQMYRYLIYDEVGEELRQIRALEKLLQKQEFDAEALELIQESHATWEVAISHFGNKAEVWNALDLPFMAGLRNLRNLLKAGAYEALDRVIEKLKDEKAVLNSKQFPFRFFSAYQEINLLVDVSREYKEKVLHALEIAMYLSVKNIPILPGKTAVIVDTSGSMGAHISERSVISYVNIASLLGAISHMISDDSLVIAFANTAEKVVLERDGSIFKNMKRIQNTEVGHSTYVEEAMELLEKSGFKPNRILLFSDMQVYSQSGTDTARKSISHYLENHGHPFFYSFDLAGYGTSVQNMHKKGIVLFSGWSEKMLNYISMVEKEGFNVIEEIKEKY
jgi:60 kDa SS-A/Ro ribonucleoprotein